MLAVTLHRVKNANPDWSTCTRCTEVAQRHPELYDWMAGVIARLRERIDDA